MFICNSIDFLQNIAVSKFYNYSVNSHSEMQSYDTPQPTNRNFNVSFYDISKIL